MTAAEPARPVEPSPLPPGGRPVPDDVPWQAWTPWQVADRLADLEVPWAVAGGWAIDLFLGVSGPEHALREHEDIEVVVPAARFDAVRAALADLTLEPVGSGQAWSADDERALAATHQTWGWDPTVAAYVLDVFREPHDGDLWSCRRDPTIRMPYADLIGRTADGVPYVVPEVVLLFKAKRPRAKDATDLAAALPVMSPGRRDRLAGWLHRVHPGHPWVTTVTAAG